MKAENIFKAYGRQGVTLGLAELAVPADLVPLRKIEKEFAHAILTDERESWQDGSGDVPVMKVRIANLKRSSNYLDVYLSSVERATHPRGVVITYPNDDGVPARWHGKHWKSERRIPFDFALSDARRAVKEEKSYARITHQGIIAIGKKWEAALADLVATLTERGENALAA